VLYFQQGTKGMYNSIEIGITANSAESTAVVWVDDFEISVTN
jgi:putative lipoic acid-binding regulatory protein